MRRRIVLGAALAVVVVIAAAQVGRAQVCVARDGLVEVLADRYGEHEAGRGLAASGQLVELFRNARTETWTLVLSDHTGRSCVLFAGRAWQGVILRGTPS